MAYEIDFIGIDEENHDHPSNGWFARPYKGIIPASV